MNDVEFIISGPAAKHLPALWTRIRQVIGVIRLRSFDCSTEAGRSQERHRRVALTGLASAAGRGVNLLITLISVPLTLRYLGVERYGLWMAISSVVAMFGFADLGIGNGLINAISRATGTEDRESMVRSVSSALVMLAGLAAALLLVFFAIYPLVPWGRLFNVNTPLAAREAGPAIAALVVCFAINMPLGIVQRVQIGCQEGFASNLWQAGGSVLSLAGLLLVIVFRGGLVWLVLAVSLGPMIALVANGGVLFGWHSPWLRPRLRQVTRAAAREVGRLGLLFFVLQVAVAVAFSSDNIVAARVLGAGAVAQYAVPFKLFAIPSGLLNMLVVPLWPAYGEAKARGDIDWISRTLKRSLTLALLFASATAIVLTLFGKPLLWLWAGPSIHPTGLLLAGLGIWTVLYAAGICLAMFLNGIHVVRFQVWCAITMASSNIVLSVLLAYRWGVAGVIWGTVISYAICTAGPMLIYVPRKLRSLRQGGAGKV